jgi:hypothetical protein
MFTKKQSILLLAIAASLSACGDNTTGNTAAPTPVASSGKAVDGYLSGSKVFCDVNKNGIADAGEATTTTNATGDFTFTAGCSDTIVVTGGNDVTTGFPFKGTLKAPAHSAVATPLTSLLADTGMTAAQLAAALGLPAGTDVTKIDPADGKHNDLLRTTLAVQQIVQQLANTLANLAGSTDTASLYSKVAGSLVSSLQASGSTPLFSADGSINQGILNAAAKSAVAATRADSKFTAFTISDADLFAAASQVSTQSTAFLTASDADLANVTAKLQNPSLPAVETKSTVNYLALSGDSVKINGSAITYANLTSGVTISTPNTFELDFSINGTPVINTVAALGMELKEVDGQGRVLQMMIDKVNIKNTNGQLTIAPDAAAKVFVYGHNSSGSDINLTLNDLTFKPLTVTNNALTLNYTSLVNKVLASVDNTTKTTAEKFTAITGTFKITVAVDGLPVRTADGTASLPTTKVSITGASPARAVNGRGITGLLTIQ